MTEVKASENINVILPENDTQELWELNGRVEAIKGACRHALAEGFSSIDAMEILMMLGEK